MPLVIVVMTAALVIGGAPSKNERESIARAFAEPRRTWPLFVAHSATFALAIAVTIFVFNAEIDVRHPWLWMGLWGAAASSSFLFWLALMIPPRAVRPLAKPVGQALGFGAVVGLLALGAGFATSILWRPMSRLTLEVVAFLLRITAHQVSRIPDELVVGTE